MELRIYRLLPCFGMINLIIGSSVQIYRAYTNGDIPIVDFVTFLCFITLLIYYCFEFNQEIDPRKDYSSNKNKLQIGIWILMSGVMVGFGFKFSKLTNASASASLAFIGVVTGANLLILHLYMIWESDKSSMICVTASKRRSKRVRVNGKVSDDMKMKERQIALVLDYV